MQRIILYILGWLLTVVQVDAQHITRTPQLFNVPGYSKAKEPANRSASTSPQTLTDEVKSVAMNFFTGLAGQQQRISAKERPVELVYSSAKTVEKPVYVLQQPGNGFVLIQSDGTENHIVGYSRNQQLSSGQFPPSFKALLRYYEEMDKKLPDSLVNLSTQQELFVTEEVVKAQAVVAPMLNTAGIHLNQFNHTEVGECPSGCVATALVQIMAFHKYPENGKGSHCYSTSNYGQQCADFENTTYNWNQTDNEFYQMVSKHVGVATDMRYCYDKDGSSPGAQNYIQQFSDYFRYHVMVIGSPKNEYVYMELDQGRPIYLEVWGDPGHALVIDGYDSNGFLHLNFGWGGSADGYYMMNTNSRIEGTGFGTNMARIAMLSTTPFTISEADSLALKALNQKLNKRWDEQTAMTNWKGLRFVAGRLVEMDMTGTNHLNGPVPEEIGQLSQLFSLQIAGNLTGQLPQSLFNLKQLRLLKINSYEEYLNTPIPASIGEMTHLEELEMTKCVKGNLPDDIGNLTKLRYLKLWSNKLTGTFPQDVSKLKKLITLEVANNEFTGSIPASLGNLDKLILLNMSKNKLEGAIPDCFSKMKSLSEFDLSENELTGNLPQSVSQLTSLTKLALSKNKLSGPLPAVFDSLAALKTIELNDNMFSALPANIGFLKSLITLDISRNQISELPSSLGNCAELRILRLYGNKVADLPSSLSRLGNMTELNLGANGLKTIPMSLLNFSNLNALDLSHNEFTAIPEVLSAITPKELYLNDNRMRGAIPVELLSRSFTSFSLKNNHFIYKDIPKSDLIINPVNEQRVVPLVADSFGLIPGDTLRLYARKVISVTSPNDVFNWYSYDPADTISKAKLEMTDSVLVLPGTEQLFKKRFYCVIKNAEEPTYRFMGYVKISSLPQLNTDTFHIYPWTEREYLNDAYSTRVLVSEEVGSAPLSDRFVTLISPWKVRGQQVWQGSTDKQSWYDLKKDMTQQELKNNLESVQEKELVLFPKTTAYYRNALLESRCVPRYSDTIKVAPLGDVICDTTIQVNDDSKTIGLDSLEITIPKGLINGTIRLSVIESDQFPAMPSGVISHGSMYEVHIDQASKFDIPLTIRFKNIHKPTFDAKKIDNYRAAYFDERLKEWVFFDQSVVDLKDTSIVFHTDHLTKLGMFELAHAGYTHIYTIPRVNVIYDNNAFYMSAVAIYDRMAVSNLNSWNTPDTDPDGWGAPYLIQDVANYTRQIIQDFERKGISTPSLRFNVYLKSLSNAAGKVDIGTYLAGRGYIYLDPHLALAAKDDLKGKREYVKTVIAHEYMHFTQDYYMTVALGNSFWMEATAPLAGQVVWPLPADLEVPEPEILLSEALNTNPAESSIFDVLAKQWYNSYNVPVVSKLASSGATDEMNLASVFLHYMSTYRPGKRLNALDLLKNTPYFSSWVGYLSDFVREHLSDGGETAELGKEYDNFVRFLYEGSKAHFNVFNENKNPDEDPLKYLKANYKSFVNKYIRFKDNETQMKDQFSISMGNLSSKMVQIYNLNNHQLMLIKYYRKSKPENVSVYTGKYNGKTNLMEWTDVSKKDTISILAGAYDPSEPANNEHMTYLLFVNKSTGDILNTSISDELEYFLLPDLKFFDGIAFFRPYSTLPLPIHVIEESPDLRVLFMGEEGQDYFGPAVFRVFATSYGTSVDFAQQITDSTIMVDAHSTVVDQHIVYNFIRDKLTINHSMDYEYTDSKTRFEDSFFGSFDNVIIRANGLNRWNANRYHFITNNSAETQASIKTLQFNTKKTQKGVDENGKPTETVTTQTYVSTTYPFGDIKMYLFFY
ncbi:MAG: C10 family peptidase [Paludibacter sp.]|jgi:Leucine-rich repeat (LRR) protein|nr:C10 family peptidase [Paludibacter sp.]